jgi:tRNA (guanine-N7-)-methyltransferase
VARRLKTDIPGPDRRVGIADLQEKGLEAIFAPDVPEPSAVVVEIGFGRGEFLRHLAAAAPGVAHLGVEVSAKRVLKMARRLARSPEEGNIRLIQGTAEVVVREVLGEGVVAAFWINFPDPWPKARHHRRRLLQAPFVRQLARRLRPGGSLDIATDHVGYAEAIDAVLHAEPLLANAFAPAPFHRDVPGRLATAYELEWRREGRPLHFFSYRRVDGIVAGAAA